MPRFLPSGDTALVVEFGDRVDQALSGLVLALAHRLEEAAIPGIVELVPTFRSLMVHYDPVRLPQAELKRRLAPLLNRLEAAGSLGRRWRIPACYDESLGLDLADVAGRMGLTRSQVIERHSATLFHVYMMGFLPGLPYLGGLPPEFELPRRENPRIKVPRGSVAVAMSMTVIYPLESPGGWHILAQTPVPMWDMAKEPPALLAAGDKVMFEPIPLARYEALLAEAAAGELRLCARRHGRMTPALRVISPGLMTTLQDLGRPGYQRLGVPVSGALDHVCLRAANLLVGNPAGMGALEIAYQGPTLAVEADSVRVAVAGGQAPIDILAARRRRQPSPRLLRERPPGAWTNLEDWGANRQRHPLSRDRRRLRHRSRDGQPIDAHARWHRRLRGPRVEDGRSRAAAAAGCARA